MDTELGRNLILWTVRLSVAFYCVAVWRYLFFRSGNLTDSVYTRMWSAAWLLCVIHVLFAFHFQHHWSHAAALQHTAEMTERVVGIHWGGGLYVNYVFLTLWGCDVARTLSGASASTKGMHSTAAFMMFNATVVFGPRWWFVPTIAFIGSLFWIRRSRQLKAAN